MLTSTTRALAISYYYYLYAYRTGLVCCGQTAPSKR